LLFAALTAQTGMNVSRSVVYRRELGQIMIAVDDAYGRIDRDFHGDAVALMPGFLPYAYREDASNAFRHLDALARPADLARHVPNATSVLSWEGSLWEQLDTTALYPGSHGSILFGRLVPPPPGTGAFLMRYIGPDAAFFAAEAARAKGDIAAARKGYEDFVARHPSNLGGQFWLGFAAYYLKDYQASERANRVVESFLPNHPAVIYNRATTLLALERYDEAITRFERVVQTDPRNYGAQLNLYWAYRKGGHTAQADAQLQTMLRLFPSDPAVLQLVERPR
jgi:tetratricopeptide (TPR) repeat protein